VALGQFGLDLSHREPSAKTNPAAVGIEMDRSVLQAQINGPVLISRAAAGGASAADAQGRRLVLQRQQCFELCR
jgi:hypothetical protein